MSALFRQPGLATSKIVEVSAPSLVLDRPDAIEIDDLRDLMRLVNDTTQRLETTHDALRSEVSRLQAELAEANAALRRSQALAALGEMAAGIAHEIRNPLGSIQLYAQMLAEDLVDRPPQAETCAKINRAVIGLDAIVRDVLSFARDLKIHPQPTTTEELFDRALAGCVSLLNGVELDRRSIECRSLQADVCLLTQALGNIIRNAVEAMAESESPRRRLSLIARQQRTRCPNGRQETRTVLSVHDTGPGIPDDVKTRIFNPFFTTRKTGTGLGLAIVHRIVDAHGGHIHIENAEAGGTSVQLFLPSAPPARQSADHVLNKESHA